MKRILRLSLLSLSLCFAFVAQGQEQVLSLDDCLQLAQQRNKQVQLAGMAIEQTQHEQRAARTHYLPKVSLTASYMHLSESPSLLSGQQQQALSQVGTTLVGGLAPQLQQVAKGLLQLHPELAPLLQKSMAGLPQMAQGLNAKGQQLAQAFDMDTRNVALASVLLTQPLYMGGKIQTYNRITQLRHEVASQQLRLQEQNLRLEVQKAYWQVVSLKGKQQLATAHRKLLDSLRHDVQKMRKAGVATRANELTVEVELNKADMTLTKVQDGLTLSRMLLAQLCGLPLDSPYRLTDEQQDSLPTTPRSVTPEVATAWQLRPELRQLDLASHIYGEKVKVERAAFLPQVALVGGWTTTYPSFVDGFTKRFNGTWHAGVMLRMPLWEWGEGRHKVRAAKVETRMAQLRAQEVRERIELQVNQSALAVNEANRHLLLTERNLAKADENLRMARVGFAEGVVSTSEVLAAQTAWLLAENERLDAQIDIRLAHAAYAQALGR